MARVLPSGIHASGRWLRPAEGIRAVAAAVEGELWREAVPRIQRRLKQAVAALAVTLAAVAALLVAASGVPERGRGLSPGALQAVALVVAGLGLGTSLALYLAARAVRPRRRLRGIATVHYPLLAMPLEGGVALYDLGGTTAPASVSLRRPRDLAVLARLADQLRQSIDRLSIFEPADDLHDGAGGALFGIDGRLRKLIERVGQALGDVTTATVRVPGVPAADPLARAAVQLWPGAEEGPAGPAILAALDPVYRANREIEGVQAAAHSAELTDLDDVLADIESCTDLLQARLRNAHLKSLDLIFNTGGLAGQTTASRAHAVFCPFCNAPRAASDGASQGGHPDLADGTRLHRNPRGGLTCPTCGKDIPEEAALVVSRLRHELFHPVFDQIVLSLRSEILAIDRDVENQLVQLTKEQRIKFQDLRMQLEQEQRRRAARIREIESRSAGLQAQVESLTAVLAHYDRVSAEQRGRYLRDCQETQQHNKAETQRMIAGMREQFDASMQGAERESLRNGQLRREEDERRHGLVAQQQQAVIDRLDGLGKIGLMTERDKERVRDTGNPFSRLNPVRIIGAWGAVARAENSWKKVRS